MFQEIHFPHSLGLLYSAFTYYTGFKVNSGEYKVMGLAPYGEPKYAKLILDNLIDLKPDGSFRLDMSYFDYCTGLTMTNDRFAELFGEPVRAPDKLLTQFHMDVAASIQAVLDEAVLRLTRSLAKETGARESLPRRRRRAQLRRQRQGAARRRIREHLDSAGGRRCRRRGRRGARGRSSSSRASRAQTNGGDGMAGSFLGPSFAQADIERRLTAAGARFDGARRRRDDRDDRDRRSPASRRSAGSRAAWSSARARSAPARSWAIRARPTMQKNLNLKVKYRESFRPFAPSVLREDVADWFELDADSPYMLLVADVRKDRRRAMTAEEQALFGIDKLNVPRSDIPAVTHVDYSARIQTVHADTNPLFHRLLTRFKALTGCPVLVNTSFNVRGEPIVCTPEDAFRCFMGNELDLLVVGNCVLQKDRAGPEPQAGLQLRLRAGLILRAIGRCPPQVLDPAEHGEACPDCKHADYYRNDEQAALGFFCHSCPFKFGIAGRKCGHRPPPE